MDKKNSYNESPLDHAKAEGMADLFHFEIAQVKPGKDMLVFTRDFDKGFDHVEAMAFRAAYNDHYDKKEADASHELAPELATSHTDDEAAPDRDEVDVDYADMEFDGSPEHQDLLDAYLASLGIVSHRPASHVIGDSTKVAYTPAPSAQSREDLEAAIADIFTGDVAFELMGQSEATNHA